MAAPIGGNYFEDEIKHVEDVSNNLTLLLSKHDTWSSKFIDVSKKLYDLSWQNGKSSRRQKVKLKKSQALAQLITAEFDEEQIWQQIELNNVPLLKELHRKISDVSKDEGKLIEQCRLKLDSDYAAARESARSSAAAAQEVEIENSLQTLQSSENQSSTEENDDANISDLSEQSDQDDDDDLENRTRKMFSNKFEKVADKRTSVVDDKFFKLHEMETFLEQEDAREEKRMRGETAEDSESEEIDFFDENDSEMDGWLGSEDENDEKDDDDQVNSSRQAKYKDFFKSSSRETMKPAKKKVRFSNIDDISQNDVAPDQNDDDDDDIDDEDDDIEAGDIVGEEPQPTGEKSPFEKRQEKLKEQISQLETENLSEKPWQMSGESRAGMRPENSLLEEHMLFDHASRTDPVITEETTKTMEDLILQRIRDKAWDDVEKKVKPTESAFEYKKRITLDQEKSKLSLAEVYEQEFLKQTQGEEQEEESKEHKEVKDLMKDLFLKLDALTNFHFTPRPAVPEVKIVSNLPSISMEEVAPVSVSDATLLAPEEIKKRPRGDVKGDSERTKTDKLRSRRQKKKKNKIILKLNESKQAAIEKRNPDMARTGSKQEALEKLKKQSKSNKSLTVLKDADKKKTNLTSSKSFFTKLQDEVHSEIKKKSGVSKQQARKTVTSRQMKL